MDGEVWVWPNVPKGTWGPKGWNWLHVTAINYPQRARRTDAKAAFRRVWNFVSNLPCIECRQHATQYVLSHPPNLAGSESFQDWAWQFHNDVNDRLGKTLITRDEYRQLYANELCWANWGVGCYVTA